MILHEKEGRISINSADCVYVVPTVCGSLISDEDVANSSSMNLTL